MVLNGWVSEYERAWKTDQEREKGCSGEKKKLSQRETEREGDVRCSVLKGVWGSALLAKHTLFQYTLSPALPLFLYLHFKTLSLAANTP